jgi:hypothetical protein
VQEERVSRARAHVPARSGTRGARQGQPPERQEAAAAEFAAVLAAEAERSLERDPTRWPWQRTDAVTDNRRRIRS